MVAISEGILERDLQAKCVAWWNQSGLSGLLFHVPNEGKRGRLEAAALGALGVMAGVSDFVLLLPNGKTHLIELKTPSGEQSDEQLRFEHNAYVLGHTYQVVRSLDDFIASVSIAHTLAAEMTVVDFPGQVSLPS